MRIDFADHAIVAGRNGLPEQIVVEPARKAASARGCRDDNAVDIDKARIARAEPKEVRTVVAGALVEGQQEGVEVSNSPCQEGLPK